MSIDINFWGTRGSFFKNGPECHEFGGHTSCISIHHADNLYIIDGGSGLGNLGILLEEKHFKDNPTTPLTAHFFLSHLHLDHICGLANFRPVWHENFKGNFYCGIAHEYQGLKMALDRFYTPPFFPIPWSEFPCQKKHYDFTIGSILNPTPTCSVETILLNHPGDGSGFAFHLNGRKIVYLCDTSHADGFFDRFVTFAKQADLLIYDASYCADEFKVVRHFGHSTWEKACELAAKANVGQLALTHHDFLKDDECLRKIEQEAQQRFPTAFAARCNQKIILA